MGKDTTSLYSKLNKIQTELNAPKNLYNKFGNYSYRNLEGIFVGLKPLLKETGGTVTVSDEIVCVNNMNYIKATVTLSDGINESISVYGWAREAVAKKGMDDSQITGSTSSYARKYACNGLFAIDDTKDADSMDNSEQKTISVADSITIKQRSIIHNLVQNQSDNIKEKALIWLKGQHTQKQADVMIKKLQSMDQDEAIHESLLKTAMERLNLDKSDAVLRLNEISIEKGFKTFDKLSIDVAILLKEEIELGSHG